MKRIVTLISVVMATVLFSGITIRAAENCPISLSDYDKLVQSNFKNQCLIVAKNCATDVSTVQQRVNDLRKEIAKGSYVYTPDQLRTLEEQLEWIESESGNQFI
jgi:hypothetical protein